MGAIANKRLRRSLKPADLEDDRDCFHHENETNDYEEKLLLGTDCGHADSSPDCKRTGITHENLGWMTIKPEEAKAGTDQGPS